MADRRTSAISQRYWPLGADSWSVPDQLEPQAYVWGYNVVCRGGIVQTRPGTEVRFCLPAGNCQGITLFTPANGVTHIVAAIAGKIYVSASPFKEIRELPGIQFNPASKFVSWAQCLKSTDYNEAGELYFLDQPYRVLVMQDGNTRAAFWDGSQSRHLNPTTSNSTLTSEGYDETRIGLWMVWSNSRLFISRGNQVFASDLGNPLKFTEAQYLNEAPAFYLPSECTGMAEAAEQAGVLAFHETGVDFIESSIIDRTQWLNTPNMHRTVIDIGCVAPKSVIRKRGLIYWFSPEGWVSLNEALNTNQSSELNILDNEMAWSKARIGPDLSTICAGQFEDYVMLSVPWCGFQNSHTWVQDQAVFEGRVQAWNGVWTGWNPVEWTTALVSNRQRSFFLSKDADGKNRVWEAFISDRTDNGCAITSSAQFRMVSFGTDERKKYLHAEIDCAQVLGEVSVMAAVAGWRGWFDRVLTKEIVASKGRVNYGQRYGDGTTYPKMGGNRMQFRTLKTEQWSTVSECNAACVESDNPVNLDRAFQLLLVWSGRMGVVGLRQFAHEEPDSHHGQCPDAEESPRTLMASGCASLEEFPTLSAFPPFTANGLYEGNSLNVLGGAIRVATSAESIISQADAQRKADCYSLQQYSWLALNSGLRVFSDGEISVTGFPVVAIYDEAGNFEILSHEFSTLQVGESEQLTVRVVNVGLARLAFTGFSVTGDGFTLIAPPTLIFLDPGEYDFITVAFVPES